LAGVIIRYKRKTNSLPFFQPLKEKEKPFLGWEEDKPLFLCLLHSLQEGH